MPDTASTTFCSYQAADTELLKGLCACLNRSNLIPASATEMISLHQVHIQQDKKTATISSVRAPFYRRVYSTLIASLEQDDALRGVPSIIAPYSLKRNHAYKLFRLLNHKDTCLSDPERQVPAIDEAIILCTFACSLETMLPLALAVKG